MIQPINIVSLMTRIFATFTHNTISKPLIVISGCTGTGKSNLAVSIAKKFDGEIINADSMQIYKGLDIVTNKLTKEEMDGIPHHLISFLEPTYSDYNVQDFKNDALEIIHKIWDNNKLPILVGGTGYYIESVIYWNHLIETDKQITEKIRSELKDKFPTPDQRYQELKRIDPEKALLVHKNDAYKVLRALEVYYITGRPLSQHYKLQQAKAGANLHYYSRLRFKNTLLINLDAEKEILFRRLSDRIDKMLEYGLVNELSNFYHNEAKFCNNYGIMQCIGMKEFLPYFKLAKGVQASEKGIGILAKCTENLKIQNRRYAQQQRKWFYNRIINRGQYREIPKSVPLDTNSHDFNCQIVPFTIKLIEYFLWGNDIDEIILDSPFLMKYILAHNFYTQPHYEEICKKMVRCDVCDLDIQGIDQLQRHLKGRKHRNTLSSKKI